MIYKPRYMAQVGEVFYFSMRLPTTKKLFRKSLRTKCLQRALTIVETIRKKIEGTRVNAELLKLLIDDEIERLIEAATALLQPRSEAGKQAISTHHAVVMNARYHNENIQELPYPVLEEKIPTFREFQLSKIDRDFTIPQLNKGDTGFTLEYSQAFAELELIEQYRKKLIEQLDKNEHTSARETITGLQQSFNTVIQATPQKSTAPLFEKALDDYIADKEGELYFNTNKNQRGVPIKEKTSEEHRGFLEKFFVHIFKGKPLDRITSKDIDDAFYLYTQFPMEKFNPYKKMNIEERLQAAYDQSVPDAQKVSSGLHRSKTALNKMFNYFYKRNIIDENPVKKMRFDDFKPGKGKGAYSCEQIALLEEYCTSQPLTPYTAAVLIMMYSGMRNGEICELTKEDIKESCGIKYFDCKGTKTPNAKRIIPVHQRLIELGILDYFNNSPERITSQQLTMWYSSRSEKLGLPAFTENGELLTFYSLRHSFMTGLGNAGLSDPHIEQLVGHAHSGTKRRYMDKFSVEVLNRSLQKLVYDYSQPPKQ